MAFPPNPNFAEPTPYQVLMGQFSSSIELNNNTLQHTYTSITSINETMKIMLEWGESAKKQLINLKSDSEKWKRYFQISCVVITVLVIVVAALATTIFILL